jgi:hypothetical protein
LWYVPLLNRLPRDHRFTLGERIINSLYELLEELVSAQQFSIWQEGWRNLLYARKIIIFRPIHRPFPQGQEASRLTAGKPAGCFFSPLQRAFVQGLEPNVWWLKPREKDAQAPSPSHAFSDQP